MSISLIDFTYLREMVLREAAIVLDESKEYLAQSRLEPVARKQGYADVTELLRASKVDAGGRLKGEIIDAMTTNETLFFRDTHPFESLKASILPELIEKRKAQRSLNIWCAAASTGQEPYSILLGIRENFPELANWRIRILATDISQTALDKARAGRYSQMEVNRGLPAKYLVKYFSRAGVDWQIDPSIARSVEYKIFNLASTWPPMGPFDLVFIRNVLIYFSSETKSTILEKAQRTLSPEGYLLLGSTESMLNVNARFDKVQHGRTTCYRRPTA